MGCCSSVQSEKLVQSSQIKRDSLYRKIVLLGAGLSGKSTLANQIRNIYGNTDDNKKIIANSDYKKYIYEQIIKDMILMIDFIHDNRTEENFEAFSNICEYTQHIIHSNNHYATLLFVNHFYDQNSFPDIITNLISQFVPQIVTYAKITEESTVYLLEKKDDALFYDGASNHINSIWKQKSIKDLFLVRAVCKLHVNESSAYFWDNIKTFSDINNYTPTMDHILKVSTPTFGVIENKINISQNVGVNIVQVGGQRQERRKWIHTFNEVAAVIFTASLSCYDEYLYEDETVYAMDEQIKLFEEVCNSNWFRDTIMILFLTKNDLFREKLQKCVPITVWNNDEYKFQDAYNDPNDYEQCLNFIRNVFQIQNKNASKQIYIHTINTLDTQMVEMVFKLLMVFYVL